MKEDLQEKAQFFAQYWGQYIYRQSNWNLDGRPDYPSWEVKALENHENLKRAFLELKPLSMISDQDAIEVAQLSGQTKWLFKVSKRDEHMIHLEYTEDCGIWHHVGITFKYGEIITNFSIDDSKSHDTNIGKIVFSAKKPVPYIAILDFLRSKRYALPFRNYTVEQLIEKGWVELIK